MDNVYGPGSNGKVSMKEVYDQVDKVRLELGQKLDNLSVDMKLINRDLSDKALAIQALKLWQENRKQAVCLEIDAALEEHVKAEHSSFSTTRTRVYIMWGVGLFMGAIALEVLLRAAGEPIVTLLFR